MEELKNNEIKNDKIEEVEYESAKKLPMGAFLGIGLAFGVATGFSVGNLLINKMFGEIEAGFAVGMIFCIGGGSRGGLALGLINKKKSK